MVASSGVGIPFEWSGEIEFKSFGAHRVSTAALKAALKFELSRHAPSSLEEGEDSVTFTAGPLRFVANFNVLAPIDGGRINIDQSGPDLVLRYQISFMHVIVIATVVLGTVFGAETFLVKDFTPRDAGTMSFAIWLWICGGNIALGLFRFRALLRHALIPPLEHAEQNPQR